MSKLFENALEEFDQAAQAYALKGCQFPDEIPHIEQRYDKAKAALLFYGNSIESKVKAEPPTPSKFEWLVLQALSLIMAHTIFGTSAGRQGYREWKEALDHFYVKEVDLDAK